VRAEELWGDWVQGSEQRQDFYSLDESAGREPAANYSQLSRHDATGLIWLLRGRLVVCLTASGATIRERSGATTTYRKHNKPALGPFGDSLDDMGRPA